MTEIIIPKRRMERGGTAAALATLNEVLLEREWCVETDTRKVKIGDGVTAWNSLPYVGELANLGDPGGDRLVYWDEAANQFAYLKLGTGLAIGSGGDLDVTGGGGGGGITALTGDVTASGSGSVAATIPSNTVTYAKMQDVSAASRVLGRGASSGSGDPQELSLGAGLSMSGTTINVSGVSGSTTYLDGISPAPVCAIGLRKLISTATNAIRVRRSSDNAEQDIGFAGTLLDSAAMLTFVGANNGFVTKFYDQTGGGFDAVQATTTKQPQIVVSGAYLGYALFDQSDDFVKITSVTHGTAYANVYFRGAFNFAASGSFAVICEASADYNTNAQSWVIDINSTVIRASANNASGVNYRLCTYALPWGGFSSVLTAHFNRIRTGNSEIALWQEGAPAAPTPVNTVEQTGVFTTYDVYLGGRGGTTFFSSLALECWVFYNADTTFKRRSVEAVVASES